MPQTWDVEEYKVWKGIDKISPVWASRQFACATYENAKELMDYIIGNNPKLILRVTKRDLQT